MECIFLSNSWDLVQDGDKILTHRWYWDPTSPSVNSVLTCTRIITTKADFHVKLVPNYINFGSRDSLIFSTSNGTELMK
jgi:hypothetical protein